MGDSIKITGGFDIVYPVPGPVMEIEVTIPEVIDAVAVALWVVPSPTGLSIVIDGAVVYPTPPSERITDEIVPAADTTAVPAAATLESWDINVISFWKDTEILFSLIALKKGLIFWTNTIVDPIPTDWIRYDVG